MKAGTGQEENLAEAPQQMTHEKMKKKIRRMKRMRRQVQMQAVRQVQAQQQSPEQL